MSTHIENKDSVFCGRFVQGIELFRSGLGPGERLIRSPD